MAYASFVELPEPSSVPHEYVEKGIGGGWWTGARPPALARDDVAAIAVAAGLIGGCVLLGLRVGWYAGLGLFFALLVLWGGFTLRSIEPRPDVQPESVESG